MTLKDIASVAGKPGIYRIVGPTRTGLLLESLDEKKSKLVTSGKDRVTVLEEISVYTHTSEGTVPLTDVLRSIKTGFGFDLPVTADSTPEQLREFMFKVLPDHDDRRVYHSDIRKLVRWYMALVTSVPEVLDAPAEEQQG